MIQKKTDICKKHEGRLAYKKALELDPDDRYALRGLAALNDFEDIIL